MTAQDIAPVKQKTFYLTEEAQVILVSLAKKLGLTQKGVLETLLRQAAKQENIPLE